VLDIHANLILPQGSSEQQTNLNLSDYSSYSAGNMIPSSNGPFLYSQTAHADLHGSVWDTTVDGTQNFHGDDDFHYTTYGHSTPTGQEPSETLEENANKWIAPEQTRAGVAKPMQRISSRSSSGSRKSKTMKSSTHKRTPKVFPATQEGAQMANMDAAGNAHLDTYLLSDSDAHSVSSQMYYQTLPMNMLPPDGLDCSTNLTSSGMTQQHIDPSQMLEFAPSITGNSPPSWSAFSPGDSRLSSPGLPEDTWSMRIDTSPTHTNDSSPVMQGVSPR
jgi:hypothetical protein